MSSLDDGARVIARSRVLRALARTLVDESRTLRRMSLQADTVVDASLVASALYSATLCAESIADKTGLPVTRVDEVTFGLSTDATVARCDACLKQTVVHRLR